MAVGSVAGLTPLLLETSVQARMLIPMGVSLAFGVVFATFISLVLVPSGYMIAEVTTAALMSENKHLANPCSTDSTPTSANQEDHVSMGANGARHLWEILENVTNVIAVEFLCAGQAIDLREDGPEGYREFIRDYFRRLTKAGKK